MQVRDLIHLLQTRCQPTDDVHFSTCRMVENNAIEEHIFCSDELDFSDVYSVDDCCVISLPTEISKFFGLPKEFQGELADPVYSTDGVTVSKIQ